MCGIAGYFGKASATLIVVSALKALSYRGYDSYGLAAITESGLFVKKSIGDVSELSENSFPEARVCIGHTRWATHGKVTTENAHPHFSCDKKIAVVHNGEIENFLELRQKLEKSHSFVSETDTEVIPHLVEDFLHKGCSFRQAFQKTLLQLKGKFAIVALNSETREMVAARNGAPLVIGLKEKEAFVASDVTGFLKHTNKAVFLEDLEMALLSETPEFFGYRTMEKIEKQIVLLEWKADEVNKGFFRHFMLKEIFEQPATVEKLLKEHFNGNEVVFSKEIIEAIKASERIILVGCGTAHYCCMIGEQMFEDILGKEARAEYASEFRYRNPVISGKDFVIAISQSGETADTLAAIQLARQKGAKVLSIINVRGSSIERASDFVLHIKAGPEIAVASTKAFTAATFLVSLIVLRLKQESGKSIEKEIAEAKIIPKKIQAILANSAWIGELSKKFAKARDALFLGRGFHYPIALEGALKLKEISYIHAEGYPAAEMKHGPIALIDENMPVFFIALKDHSREKIISNIQEVIARKGKVISVCNAGDNEIKNMSDFAIEIPETLELFSPLLSAIPLQLVSYCIAEERGCEIDKPRNLAKVISVE